jgi:MoxR-like ATPase
LAGRFHVSIEDIRQVAKPALRHRLILNFEGEAEGVTADQVLDEIVAALPEASV